MSNGTMVGRDLYYGTTNHQGKTTVHYARVWNGELFLASQRDAGQKAKDAADRFTVTPATEADYKKQWRKPT